MRRSLTVLAVAMVAALAAAACGGSAEDDYKEGFPPLSERIVALGQEVGEGIETAGESTDRELADEFAGFARRLGGLRRRLERLEPPEEVAGEHDVFVDSIGGVQSSLEEIADAAEASDPAAARDATESLVRRSAELREARAELARAVREL